MKRKELMIMHGVLVLGWFIASAAAGRTTPQEKAESVTPIPKLSPPEGNMTFIDGVTWCVARPGATQEDLQNALDWACGPGGADCSQLQPGGRCYQPNTLLTHASYAFNIFYQQNGNADIACNFGGAGALVKRDPSFGSCKFLASDAVLLLSLSLSLPGTVARTLLVLHEHSEGGCTWLRRMGPPTVMVFACMEAGSSRECIDVHRNQHASATLSTAMT